MIRLPTYYSPGSTACRRRVERMHSLSTSELSSS